mgnify:CR=1 FL=1
MRVSDDRYSRDRQRIDLALRFIHHEARTRTIRIWTGLTDDRIRKLYRSYVADDVGAARERRGGREQAEGRPKLNRKRHSALELAGYLPGDIAIIDLNNHELDLRDNLGCRYYIAGENGNVKPIKELLQGRKLVPFDRPFFAHMSDLLY